MLYSLMPEIKNTPVFMDVSEEYVNKIFNSTNVEIQIFPPNTLAYSLDIKPIKIGIIISGSAKVYAGKSKAPALLRTLTKGDIFGIANLYDDGDPFPSKIVTEENTTIAFIDGNTFKSFIEKDETALKNYLSLLTKKIMYLNQKIATYTASSTERRLAYYLIDNSTDDVVTLSCSISQLAELLNVGRASLYRSIDTLEKSGAIKRKSKRVIIINKEILLNVT